MKENIKKKNFFDGIIPEMKKFYKQELKTKHMWNFVIALFIYFTLLICFKTGVIDLQELANTDIYTEVDTYTEQPQVVEQSNNIQQEKSRFDAIKSQLGLVVVGMISGLTPYINIPVLITGIYPLIVAANISTNSVIIILLMSLVILVEIYFITLLVAVGMYWCKMATKHFRYSQSSSFTFDDVRLQYNEAMKKEEKVEEIRKKMMERNEKIQALNVKINYKAIFIFGIIAALILSICTLITGV